MNFTIYFYLLQNYKLSASRPTQPLRLAHIQLLSRGHVPESAAPRVPVKTVPDLSLPHPTYHSDPSLKSMSRRHTPYAPLWPVKSVLDLSGCFVPQSGGGGD